MQFNKNNTEQIIFKLLNTILLTFIIVLIVVIKLSDIPSITDSNKVFYILILFIITILLSVICILCIEIKSLIPEKVLISTNTYDIYELVPYDDSIGFSYINEENQIINDNYHNETFSEQIYMSENNQVTVEYWGYNGNVSDTKITKFHLTEDTYKEFSGKYGW